MNILIKNGRVIDPASNTDTVQDIYIESGTIQDRGANLQAPDGAIIIDATGMWVTPGLVDMHVHLRDPGWPNKETIASGTAAAAAGGFTTICPMANTNPVTDNELVVAEIIAKSKKEGQVHVIPIGSITKGLEGKEISPLSAMKSAGICAISDDGKTVEDTALFKSAMEQAAALGIPVLSHCEDLQLVDGGHFNAGPHTKAMGVKGISNESEASIIARDINLARETGTKLHICHVSTAEGVAYIREAQSQGLPITAEVCPHHFALADEDIPGLDTNYKMSPPLRSPKDIEALKAAIKDGTISVIATDHAPHHEDDKNCGIEKAANGIIGLETAIPLCITELVQPGLITPPELIAKLTINPAQILGLDKGTLSIGKMADITIIDPNIHHTIDKNTFLSKSRNTPFHGRAVQGNVIYTIVEGRVVYDNRQAD
ncbi:MAG: dihydroorotase [Defluviitaleaceae bacterium]|nr:dihydroorotase [Defluviitaleaceae bacterium]